MHLTDSEIIDFINRQLNSTAADLMLQASKYPDWDMKAIAQQLNGKQIAKKKLPTWFKLNTILYPVRLSMEQCSSEATAVYKNSIINYGNGIDLTGGFGVDTYYLSLYADSIIYCEKNEELARLVKHNFNVLSQKNCTIHIGDGLSYLKSVDKLDWIYIDPARRKGSNRVFRLEDCEPNIIDVKDAFLEKANQVLIKTSPLLDIQHVLANLNNIREVHVVSVNNDCKEVLYLLEKEFLEQTQLYCINIKNSTTDKFCFTIQEESIAAIQYSLPLRYLYEPNSSIMKAGAFKSVGVRYNLFKIHKHSHLYTSDEFIENFPGRSFKINTVLPIDKKQLFQHTNGKVNLTCRNFPQKIDVLKKKLRVKDGGDYYVFATTLRDGKPKLIVTHKN